mgnify:CR=1 FL=1
MKVFETVKEMQKYAIKQKSKGKSIGFVPTMGALHDGHFSLVKAGVKKCDITFASIFVNPTQFAPGEDLDKYPRTLEQDKKKLKKLGVNALFLPSNEIMYEPGYNTWVEITGLTAKLCGKSRPSHFKGVTTVVSKLFNICLPDYAFFGQKDYQQCVVIKRMIRDLNFPVKIKVCPIVREKDGLAMSSRNKYLNEEQREQALVLYKSLNRAKEIINSGEKQVKKIISEMKSIIKTASGAKIDYMEIIDAHTLEAVTTVERDVAIALAVYIGKTRLIDNIILTK